MRNIYAHGDGVFKRGVEFPDRGKTIGAKINPYPETITWGNISITRGQKTAPAINEVQVSRLLSHIMIFFTSNDYFNIGILGNQNLSKPI